MTPILQKNKITAETNLKFKAILSPETKIFWKGKLTSKSYPAAKLYFASKYNKLLIYLMLTKSKNLL